MERVLAAMRRVVERLQGENEQLKKALGAGGPQYSALMKENLRLKVHYYLLYVWETYGTDLHDRATFA